MYGMPEERAEEHRRALRELAKHMEPYDLRCRHVERVHLPMRWGFDKGFLLPPEMDVYGGGRFVVTVAVVDVPGGGAWYLVKRPDGLPVQAYTVGDPAHAAEAIAADTAG
ncbi:hypothetical protein Sme01_35380 [Sphaerisporangium melleum]|uniref:Uncharacterized protein n=2 Tax=Sphaerisporangium melleum TaxID=321316 RepID=A0A917RA80_9ACTN|nr:hypothetical protein GCM10007964_44040 [Sphaerisporangium melleum]GII71062.1 hypothetical protein Sme01_35380 [Sphaerisporangium melleum]